MQTCVHCNGNEEKVTVKCGGCEKRFCLHHGKLHELEKLGNPWNDGLHVVFNLQVFAITFTELEKRWVDGWRIFFNLQAIAKTITRPAEAGAGRAESGP